MLSFLNQYRQISVFLFFVLLALALLSFNRPAETLLKPSNVMERTMLLLLQPFQSTVARVLTNMQHVGQDYLVLVRLNETNQQLRTELAQLRAEKNRYAEKALAYDRLKGPQALVEEREFATILARVIGYDPTNQTNTVVVDQGSAAGVKESWPVITQAGIVGMTVAVSTNASKILLLTDPNCNVAALIQRTRDQGIVGGQLKKDSYLMKYVNRKANIREGAIYQLTDPALKELAKEGLPGFRLTEHAFNKLQTAGMPADLLMLLEDSKDLLYVSQQSFVAALEATIGKEQTEWYKATILEAATADLLAKLQALKEQTYPTEAAFVNALESTIGKEQTQRYKDLMVRHGREEETVVSSGLGGIFPKGLLIGTVSKVIKQDYGLFHEIEITPGVDFAKLEEVLIIRRENKEIEN